MRWNSMVFAVIVLRLQNNYEKIFQSAHYKFINYCRGSYSFIKKQTKPANPSWSQKN